MGAIRRLTFKRLLKEKQMIRNPLLFEQAQNKIPGQNRQILFEGLPPQTQDFHRFFRPIAVTLREENDSSILSPMHAAESKFAPEYGA